MKTDKITNLALNAPAGADTQGYNVHDYFSVDRIEDRRFISEDDASDWADKHYLGLDPDGIGVTWEIEAEEVTPDRLDYAATTDEDWDNDEDGEPVCRTTTTVSLLLDGEEIAIGEASGYYSICYASGEQFSEWQDSDGPETDATWDAIVDILLEAGAIEDQHDLIDAPAAPAEPEEDPEGEYVLLYHGWEQDWMVRGRYANQEDANRAMLVADRATKEANSPGSYGWDFAVATLDEDGEEIDGLRVTILTGEE